LKAASKPFLFMEMTMKFNLRAVLATLTFALVLAGCSSTPLDEPTVESRTPVPAAGAASGAGNGASSSAAEQSRVATVDLSKTDNNGGADAEALAKRIIYFDYDSFVIQDEYRPILEAHAKALRANPNKGLVIEGHTDERGGSEYNLALGQKRAESVLKALVLLGVPAGQLEAVSFGKERPLDPGHDEAAWAKNRRAVLKDR